MRPPRVLAVSLLVASGSVLAPAARAGDAAPAAPAAPAPAAGVVFEPGTPPFAEVLAKAKAAGKPVFVDFTTEWCGWCRRLEKDTFAEPSVGAVMQGFVNVQVDAEKGEGPDLAKRYGVHGFPTLVVVDAAGEEVDRIVGYLPPAEFTKEVRRILAGEGTLPALRKAYAASPDDLEAGLTLGSKLALTRPAEAIAIFGALGEKAKGKDRATQAKILLEGGAALLAADQREEAGRRAETLVMEFADTPAAAEAAARLGRVFLSFEPERALGFLAAARGIAKEAKDRFLLEDLAVGVHRGAIADALLRQGEAAAGDPELLNQVAWTCFEQRTNLHEARAMAQRAVEGSGRAPEILDTLANLLWVLGETDEAMKVEEEAAAKAPPEFRGEFQATLAKWKALAADRKATGVVPAVPLLPAPKAPAPTEDAGK